MRNVWRVGFVAASVMTLAACSDFPLTSGEAKTAGGELMSLVAATPVTTIPDVYDAAHTPASGEFVGALDDISAHTCAREAEGWRVTGTATNTTASPVDYRIFIGLLNGVSTTRALVETEVLNVAAGGSGEFDTVIAMPEDDLRCVLRVERRNLGV
jgi:hypothetical protein